MAYLTASPQEKQDWATSRAAKVFEEDLRTARQEAMEAWANDVYTAGTAEASMQKNAFALGGVRIIDQILEKLDTLARGEQL